MKKVGIVICNYNKCEDILLCIESVMQSNFKNFDIFVVDNASTDDSVKEIKKKYENQLTLLENKTNLGGSGGFNTGIRKVVKFGYEYLMCLDNDVILDKDAVGSLYDFLGKNKEIGILGSKVYHMEAPEYIQQFGLNLDFQRYCAETLYADYYDDGKVPEVVYCDTVATCSVMLRTKVIEKAGIMPEDNFIYWDDMEWGYCIGKAGYKVAAYGKSKVWHRMGANNAKKSSFLNYYLWRNQIHFFMKFTPKEKIETMSVYMLREIFDALYESMYRGEHNTMNTIRYAFDDALHMVRGKAEEHKLLGKDEEEHKLETLITDKNSYYIEENGYKSDVRYLENVLYQSKPGIKKVEKKEDAELIFSMCDYIMQIQDFSFNKIYIDTNRNLLVTEEDAMLVQNYNFSKTLFIYMNQNLFLDAVKKVQKNIVKNL